MFWIIFTISTFKDGNRLILVFCLEIILNNILRTD